REDTIHITDAFLARAVPAILAHTPGLEDRGSLLENFLEINGALRKSEAEDLRGLAKKSTPAFLWHRPFERLPRAAAKSSFADHRTYVYKGKVIDHQYHLGIDLASVERAPIPAANDGIVLMARYFGIYGNAVVIDHGYGLMSLYGHLSSFAVKEGDHVRRGQVIGQTGETGLAGGDHLHFTMLLDGVPVKPHEWWDPHWIHDRVASKLGKALEFTP
ncbi:MAG TPA: M23 family metallopeptidase, partial [Thermoanaerobaculia bacterium]|nr:M23 family metallopeptidase [Thermoanaerobaculia bacterium]